MPPKSGFYAVAIGRKVGVFSSWDNCRQQTEGFSRPKFQKFDNLSAAKQYVQQYASPLDYTPASLNLDAHIPGSVNYISHQPFTNNYTSITTAPPSYNTQYTHHHQQPNTQLPRDTHQSSHYAMKSTPPRPTTTPSSSSTTTTTTTTALPTAFHEVTSTTTSQGTTMSQGDIKPLTPHQSSIYSRKPINSSQFQSSQIDPLASPKRSLYARKSSLIHDIYTGSTSDNNINLTNIYNNKPSTRDSSDFDPFASDSEPNPFFIDSDDEQLRLHGNNVVRETNNMTTTTTTPTGGTMRSNTTTNTSYNNIQETSSLLLTPLRSRDRDRDYDGSALAKLEAAEAKREAVEARREAAEARRKFLELSERLSQLEAKSPQRSQQQPPPPTQTSQSGSDQSPPPPSYSNVNSIYSRRFTQQTHQISPPPPYVDPSGSQEAPSSSSPPLPMTPTTTTTTRTIAATTTPSRRSRTHQALLNQVNVVSIDNDNGVPVSSPKRAPHSTSNDNNNNINNNNNNTNNQPGDHTQSQIPPLAEVAVAPTEPYKPGPTLFLADPSGKLCPQVPIPRLHLTRINSKNLYTKFLAHFRHAPDTIIIHTDGSASPNPGPAGSGILIEIPLGVNHKLEYEYYVSYGISTNQWGEIRSFFHALNILPTAIADAQIRLEELHPRSSAPSFPNLQRIVLLSDSKWGMNIFLENWAIHSEKFFVNRGQQINPLLPRLRSSVWSSLNESLMELGVEIKTFTPHLVKAHCGLEGNEKVDKLAKMGRQVSERETKAKYPNRAPNYYQLEHIHPGVVKLFKIRMIDRNGIVTKLV